MLWRNGIVHPAIGRKILGAHANISFIYVHFTVRLPFTENGVQPISTFCGWRDQWRMLTWSRLASQLLIVTVLWSVRDLMTPMEDYLHCVWTTLISSERALSSYLRNVDRFVLHVRSQALCSRRRKSASNLLVFKWVSLFLRVFTLA